jgi:hypothetical protein
LKSGSSPHLTYCSNIHPGESWPEVQTALAASLPRVRALLGHEGPMAIGLRLSARAADALSQPRALEQFHGFLGEGDYYVPTVNGFPHGTFHGARVKERVYLPDWRDPARLEYSNTLAALLADLLARRPDIEGSVSTVPGAFRAAVAGEADRRAIAAGILQHAAFLSRLRTESGRTIVLAIEPEPACLIETVDDVLAFFDSYLFNETIVADAARHSRGALSVEDVRRHIGVCFDACHMAVEFEDPVAAFARVRGAGIRVGKVQLSSALRFTDLHLPGNLAALDAFAEDTYLHQVVQRRAAGLSRFSDLPLALAAAQTEPPAPGDEWRVHFHVPVFLDRAGPFHTTQAYLAQVIGLAGVAGVTPCLEVETYTWDVLPPELRTADLCSAIARELSWVRSTLNR